MSCPSKEERVLELFLNSPSRHWHFSKIVKCAEVSDPIAHKWLKKLVSEKMIKRVKPKGKMPYFISNFQEESYRTRKRLYALQQMYDSGLLLRLKQLDNAKTVIVFGSFSRSDWNEESDVDVFVLGDPEDLKFGTLWKGLGFHGGHREVSVHSFSSLDEVKRIHSGLMKHVVKGFFVKGDIYDVLEAVT